MLLQFRKGTIVKVMLNCYIHSSVNSSKSPTNSVWQEIIFHETLHENYSLQRDTLPQTKPLRHNDTNQQKRCDVD